VGLGALEVAGLAVGRAAGLAVFLSNFLDLMRAMRDLADSVSEELAPKSTGCKRSKWTINKPKNFLNFIIHFIRFLSCIHPKGIILGKYGLTKYYGWLLSETLHSNLIIPETKNFGRMIGFF
jgi:hypothetical protein